MNAPVIREDGHVELWLVWVHDVICSSPWNGVALEGEVLRPIMRGCVLNIRRI